ncbi:MAG: hypothetical protein MI754_13630, partial [Chromatiales bacterium]|nr:hypothetical protein [Chromatiales bacterium]
MSTRPQRSFRQSIRFKLMLVSLSLLLIPWAGYHYLQENEAFLRNAQEDVLFGTAQAVAATLRNQPDLFISGATTSAGSSNQYLYVHPLTSNIQVDGYNDDWQGYIHNAWRFDNDRGLAFDLVIAQNSLHLYLLLHVDDEQIIFREPGNSSSSQHDAVELSIINPQGELQDYRISTTSPGWADVYRLSDDGLQTSLYQTATLIKSEWQTTHSGYALELRIPRYLVGDNLAISISDVDHANSPPTRLSTQPADSPAPNQLITVSPSIQRIISGIAHDNTRIWVVDRFQRVLARRGSLQAAENLEQNENEVPGLLKLLFNLVLAQPTEQFQDDYANRIQIQAPEIASALNGTPDTRRRTTPDQRAVILSATWPIHASEGIVGGVLVEQTTNQILSLQNRAIEGLFGVTLLLFITTSLLLLGFATLLTGRVHRLRNRVEEAVTHDGRILNTLKPDNSSDEIGDLSRSFASVLNRLSEYNRYLEAMASRLAHELRTPLTVVRSSLDNLSQEALPEERDKYLDRAKDGVERLAIILHRMREATRLEQLLQQTELETFDLAEMLNIATESYRSAFPDIQFEITIPSTPVSVTGSPELLSQALDKLISNASDFHTKGTPVEITLQRAATTTYLSISNQGPALPKGMEQTIF